MMVKRWLLVDVALLAGAIGWPGRYATPARHRRVDQLARPTWDLAQRAARSVG